MGDHLLTDFHDERESGVTLGVVRVVLASIAALAATLTALFLLHH
jgi:hypothetical protein